MRLFAFGLSAIAALALSAGTASAQHGGHSHSRPAVVSPGHSHGPTVVSPGYGGGFGPRVPSYSPGFAPGYGGGFVPAPRGHYDYVPGHFDRHRGHYDYKPGHFDYHAPFTPRPRH